VGVEQPRALTDQRLRRALTIASNQAGVISRRQLYAAGVTHGQVRANVRARRWSRVGSQAIAVHTGPLPSDAQHWAAVFEAGPRAMLDGASALIGSGLQYFTVERIRVSVPRGARVRRARRCSGCVSNRTRSSPRSRQPSWPPAGTTPPAAGTRWQVVTTDRRSVGRM